MCNMLRQSSHAHCAVAEVADLVQRRLEVTAACVTAERPAAEPGSDTEGCTLPAAPAIDTVQPPAALPGGTPGASLPHNDGARQLQLPDMAAAEATADGQPQRRGAASPSASKPLTELQSSQPAATESADVCMEEVSSPERQQPARLTTSPAADGPTTDVPGPAAVAADSTVDPCTAASTLPAEEHRPAQVKAEPPDSIAGPGPGNAPPADVAEAAVDAPEIGAVNPSAASVDMSSSPEAAQGAGQGLGLVAMAGAHLLVQLAVSHQDDTVNITSASPRCVSPSAVLDHVLAEGPVSTVSPSLGRSAAAAFAAVSQHIHDYDDACEDAGAQSPRQCMLLCYINKANRPVGIAGAQIVKWLVVCIHHRCVDSIFLCNLALMRNVSRQGRVVRRRGSLLPEPAGLAGHELAGRVRVRGRGGAAGRRVGGG